MYFVVSVAIVSLSFNSLVFPRLTLYCPHKWTALSLLPNLSLYLFIYYSSFLLQILLYQLELALQCCTGCVILILFPALMGYLQNFTITSSAQFYFVSQFTFGLPRWGRRHGFNPWVGKILWSRNWHPTPVHLTEKFHRISTGALHATVHEAVNSST